MRIAVQIHPQHGDVAGMRRAVVAAEEMGADVIYVWDHFHPLYGDPDGNHFECWSLLAAWAEATSRVELGALVSCNSYRNPHLLADMARTIDHISNGRLIFGIGSGWFERDYLEYGYEFGTAVSRLEALAANLPIFQERWAKLQPPPTRHLPILIGGSGPRRTLPLVAQYADAWHAGFPSKPEDMERPVARLLECCAAIGRDPAEIEWSIGIEPEALGDDLAKHADGYREMGFRQITLGVNGPDYDVEPVRDWLAWRDSVNA
jgi:probable F420-dependent oxidoreductase